MGRFENLLIIGNGTIAVAVLEYCISLKKRHGFELSYLRHERQGGLSAESICEKYDIECLNILDKEFLTDYFVHICTLTLIISAGNNYLFPRCIVEKENLEIINFHYALLPWHKGRNAPSWAIFNHETKTGATWHYVDSDIDSGDIIWQKECFIDEDMRTWQLIERIMEEARKGIEEFLPNLLERRISGRKQKKVIEKMHHSKEVPGDGYFDLTDDSSYIYGLLRALDWGNIHPLGYAETILNNGLKIQIKRYKRIVGNSEEEYKKRSKSIILDYDENTRLYMKYTIIGNTRVVGISLTLKEIERIKAKYSRIDFENITLPVKNFIYDSEDYNKLKEKIQNENIEVLVINGRMYDIGSRLAWECSSVKKCITTDPSENFPIESENIRCHKKMWNMLAVQSEQLQSKGAIEQSGWFSSLKGTVFSESEMAEYVQNTYKKVIPYCKDETVLLEIGIGSGLICEVLCGYVKKYIGIDISEKTLLMTEQRLRKKGIWNVELKCGGALEVDSLDLPLIDIVVINSVAQYFPGYMYFISVLKKAVTRMRQNGIIFIGDLPDYDKREAWRLELQKAGKKINQRDLWFSKKFIWSIPAYVHGISDIVISEKTGNIENELTKNRMDVLLIIDKYSGICTGKKKVFEVI